MPNWCANRVTVTHKDPDCIQRVKKGFLGEGLFKEFLPCPAELHEHTSPEQDEKRAAKLTKKYGAPDWYTWQSNNWGVKWDVSGDDGFVDNETANSIDLQFDSAWGPPITFFEYMVEQGFEVKAYFYEPGMQFAGTFTNEEGEDTADYGEWTPAQIREYIPELDERFCISEQVEEYYEENPEIEINDTDHINE